MRRRDQITLADVAALGISPALLIGLMTSLTFFLLEIAYRGDYPERLRFIFFCFIVGSVLISRIAMTMGRGRALAYAFALGAATILVLGRFVETKTSGPLGAIGAFVPYLAVGLIWWCVDLLTYDCTHTGGENESGLLDLGLLKKTPAEPEADDAAGADREKGGKPKSWAEQYQDERRQEQRRHRPGFWLVIFSLAALPLFAIGQAAIPAAAEEQRRFVFWLLTCYLACGLGLLLTTSFLGLRRYLRLRKLEMPTNLTAMWLGVGAAMIVALLLLATFLPRPAAEYSVPGLLGMAGSKKRDADRLAFFNFEGGRKQGQAGGQGQNAGDPQQQGGGPAQRDASAQAQVQGRHGQDGKQGQGQPQSGGKTQNGQQQGQGQGGKPSGGNDGKQETSQNPNDPQNQGGDRNQANPNDANRQAEQGSAPNQQGERRSERPGDRNDPNRDQARGRSSEPEKQDQGQMDPPQFEPPEAPSALMGLLKWLVLLAALLGLGFALIRYRNELMEWLRSLFAGWGWETKSAETTERGSTQAEAEDWRPPPPFSSFRDPFEQPGRFKSNESIVRYSYAALESWAYEQHLGRKPEETPLEFIRKLADARPRLDEPGKKLVDLYARITYAKGRATQAHLEAVREFWRTLPRPAQAQPAAVE